MRAGGWARNSTLAFLHPNGPSPWVDPSRNEPFAPQASQIFREPGAGVGVLVVGRDPGVAASRVERVGLEVRVERVEDDALEARLAGLDLQSLEDLPAVAVTARRCRD